LFRRVGHPVMWVGALIGALDRRFNNATRVRGVLALAVVLVVTVTPTLKLPWPIGLILAASLLAKRSLWDHVAAVADGLALGLEEGRSAVAHIVGRDPDSLDEAGVARAAIESLAENFSDGVVAPAVWCALLGVPGIVAYKAINTADSMIGHRTKRYAAFGWAAARLDDVVNLPASRLAALWIVLASVLHPTASAIGAWHAVWRDARHHRSPNAGWPEAAMAGVADAWMGNGCADATGTDIRRALSLYRLACSVQIAIGLCLCAL
jgi:adenosylcobinamide-phosphate synthase